MTEKEAIKGLKDIFSEYELALPFTDSVEILNMAIQALEEIWQYRSTGMMPDQVKEMQMDYCAKSAVLEEYRAIGTVEECRAAMVRMKPKKPIQRLRGVYDDNSGNWLYDEDYCICPTCKTRNEVYIGWIHCPKCGQALDWKESEQ